HLQYRESQLAGQGTRSRPSNALRLPDSRRANLLQSADAALLSAGDDRIRLLSPGTKPCHQHHQGLQLRSPGCVDPAGNEAAGSLRLELRLSLRAVAQLVARPDTVGCAAVHPRVAVYEHTDPRGARRSARRNARVIPVAGVVVLAALAGCRQLRQ